MDALSRHPAVALAVAGVATAYPDNQARWQTAVVLGRIGGRDAIVQLEKLQGDDDEYVRRRSRFAQKEIEGGIGS
jgi:HEAT repeat protein